MTVHILKLVEALKVDPNELQDILENTPNGRSAVLDGLFVYVREKKVGDFSSSFQVGIWNGPIENEQSKCRFNGEIYAPKRTESYDNIAPMRIRLPKITRPYRLHFEN
jgi:hypothetical protein